MTAFALSLILAAAFIHACWNYLLKRSGGGPVFVWLFASLSALIYAPLAALILWWERPEFGWMHFGLMFASAALHTAYYLLLDRGYRSGDLSVVYPLARGSGPLITMLCAVLLMTPMAVKLKGEIPLTWRRARKEIVAVALLCPLSYILVLTAMVFTPVSYVAPAREVSILVAALMGTQLLAEGDAARRMTAAAAMVAGVVRLAAG